MDKNAELCQRASDFFNNRKKSTVKAMKKDLAVEKKQLIGTYTFLEHNTHAN